MDEPTRRKNESGVNFYIRVRIREERQEAHLPQNYMAYALGRTLVAYNRLENGRIQISVNDLVAIANILGIAVVNLMPPDPNAKSNWTPGQWHILKAYEESKQMDAQSATPQPTQPKTRSSTKRRKTKTR
jgi:transcriptional regulator with XRE-family HTH domain